MQEQIGKVLDRLHDGLLERDEVIKIAFLGALAGENIFLYGPPGVAKSLISRRIASAFGSTNYFEYLMQKFSTPEDVFGPISLSELKKDNYIRKVEGYLPKADFAFLDEIFKANPAILNTLLTIINEKIFKNGDTVDSVPLKVLISASNETPPDNQGLEALYDRFLIRVPVMPMQKRENFEAILQNGAVSSSVEIDKSLQIKDEQWREFRDKINKVIISQDTFLIINAIRLEIEKLNKAQNNEDIIYISDRRWQKAGYLLKASAFFNNRNITNIADCFLLTYTLWSKEDQFNKIEQIVNSAIKDMGVDIGIDLSSIKSERESLEKEIKNELFYMKDKGKFATINGKEYFEYDFVSNAKIKIKNSNLSLMEPIIEDIKKQFGSTIYIEKNNFNTNIDFNPISKDGKKISNIVCNFKNSKTCYIDITKLNTHSDPSAIISAFASNTSINTNQQEKILLTFTPKTTHQKGEIKDGVSKRLLDTFNDDIEELMVKIAKTLQTANQKKKEFLSSSKNIFLSDEKVELASTTINNQVEEIVMLLKDSEALKSLISDYKKRANIDYSNSSILEISLISYKRANIDYAD